MAKKNSIQQFSGLRFSEKKKKMQFLFLFLYVLKILKLIFLCGLKQKNVL